MTLKEFKNGNAWFKRQVAAKGLEKNIILPQYLKLLGMSPFGLIVNNIHRLQK